MSDSVFVQERRPIAIRPLALPSEHGGWSLLLEPILLGLLVAPSTAGLLIACGAVAAFLLRHPLKLAAHDWTHRRYPRTSVCEALAATYLWAAALSFLGSYLVAGARPLIALATAIPFGLVQFVYELRRKSRTLPAEIAGASAPAACVAAIAIAGGASAALAAALAVLILCRSIPAILYVRFVLRGERRTAMLAAHAVAMIIAALLSWTAAAAMAILFARALSDRHGVTPQRTGFREAGFGALTIALIAIAYRL